MTTKFNVGDTVLIKGIVETIYVETTDNEPIYHVRIKGGGTCEAYGIRVSEDIMEIVDRGYDIDYFKIVKEAKNDET